MIDVPDEDYIELLWHTAVEIEFVGDHFHRFWRGFPRFCAPI
jgi:hypothetical protein